MTYIEYLSRTCHPGGPQAAYACRRLWPVLRRWRALRRV